MSHTFYSYVAYIPPTSNADINGLKNFLDAFYSTSIDNKPHIKCADNQLHIRYDNSYTIYVYLSEDAHVQEEAVETADERETDWNDSVVNKETLQLCKRRFEVWGDEDFDMEYFNDSLFVMEQIENFKDVIIFDLQ